MALEAHSLRSGQKTCMGLSVLMLGCCLGTAGLVLLRLSRGVVVDTECNCEQHGYFIGEERTVHLGIAVFG